MNRARLAGFLALSLALWALFWQRTAPALQDRHECFIFADGDRSQPLVSDLMECRHPTAPASTFKIPHALIALQANVITAETRFKWDGTAYDFESWRRDHTLDSAMKWSVLPFFQRTARIIGTERMHRALESLNYAADTFEGEITTFWVNGDLVISPMEQFTFIQRFFAGTLAIDDRHVSTVKQSVRMPRGHIVNAAGVHSFALTWPPSTIVRAKTGSTTVNGERVNWLIGALELNGVNRGFVARARATGELARSAAIELALRELNARSPSR